MEGRTFSSDKYRYGFNGQEKDKEIFGFDGTEYNYKLRILDSRLGRFFSVDLKTADFPWYSPYQFAGNKPIRYIDLDGAEEWDNSGTVTPYIKPIPYKQNSEDIMNFLTNNTVIALYNTASGVINAVPAAYNYLASAPPNGAPTMIVNDINEGWDDFTDSQEEYWNTHSWKDMLSDAGNSFTKLENYDLAAQLLITHKITVGGSVVKGMSIEQKVLARENFARQFYQMEGFTAEKAASHMEGINFGKGVEKVTLKKGDVIQQWVGENGVGSYFTTAKNGASQNLGIGDYQKRVLKQFTVTEDIEVLKSTAGDYKGNSGGGTQYFSTKLKNVVEEKK
jgi:RHS repeat-associated protein